MLTVRLFINRCNILKVIEKLKREETPWGVVQKSLSEACQEVRGMTTGRRGAEEWKTWWWNKNVKIAFKAKKDQAVLPIKSSDGSRLRRTRGCQQHRLHHHDHYAVILSMPWKPNNMPEKLIAMQSRLIKHSCWQKLVLKYQWYCKEFKPWVTLKSILMLFIWNYGKRKVWVRSASVVPNRTNGLMT